jgi:hypothetical protein
VEDVGIRVVMVRSVLNTMNGPTDAKVRAAFAVAGTAPPDDSFVRTRRALVSSAADPAVQAAVRRSLLDQHAALLDGRTPAELRLDTTPRKAPFIAGYGPEPAYRTVLRDHLDLPPTIRFAHGGWVVALSLTMRVAEALAPVFAVLLAALVLLLAGTVLVAETRGTGVRRAGISLLAAAFVLYLLFDGLVAIFFRATRSVEAEVAGRFYQSLVSAWSGSAAVAAGAGAVLVASSLLSRR